MNAVLIIQMIRIQGSCCMDVNAFRCLQTFHDDITCDTSRDGSCCLGIDAFCCQICDFQTACGSCGYIAICRFQAVDHGILSCCQSHIAILACYHSNICLSAFCINFIYINVILCRNVQLLAMYIDLCSILGISYAAFCCQVQSLCVDLAVYRSAAGNVRLAVKEQICILRIQLTHDGILRCMQIDGFRCGNAQFSICLCGDPFLSCSKITASLCCACLCR